MVTMVLIPSLASLGRYGGYLFPRLSCLPQVICDLRGEVSFRYNILYFIESPSHRQDGTLIFC